MNKLMRIITGAALGVTLSVGSLVAQTTITREYTVTTVTKNADGTTTTRTVTIRETVTVNNN